MLSDRDQVYLIHFKQASRKMFHITQELTYETFVEHDLVPDVLVIRQLGVIGEACTRVTRELPRIMALRAIAGNRWSSDQEGRGGLKKARRRDWVSTALTGGHRVPGVSSGIGLMPRLCEMSHQVKAVA